jgi:hypothetical protein
VIPVKTNGQRRVFCLRSNLVKEIGVWDECSNGKAAALSE